MVQGPVFLKGGVAGTSPIQFVIFKPLTYYFQETMRFDVKVSFASRPLSCLIR